MRGGAVGYRGNEVRKGMRTSVEVAAEQRRWEGRVMGVGGGVLAPGFKEQVKSPWLSGFSSISFSLGEMS